MVDSPESLLLISRLAEVILAAHAWVSTQCLAAFAQPLPLPLFVALPFVLPAAWALAMRQPLLLFCVAGLAWLSSTALIGADFAPIGALQFSISIVAAFYLCAKARLDARRTVRLRAELDEAQLALALTANSLDRERFWRRASGDLRAMVGDSEIATLIERIQSFRRKRIEEQEVPRGA